MLAVRRLTIRRLTVRRLDVRRLAVNTVAAYPVGVSSEFGYVSSGQACASYMS